MFAAVMKRIAFSFVVLLVTYAALVYAPGCANIIPPQGGPRDSLPPLLLNTTPADSTTNFRSKRIVFTFDEFVDLRELPKNVIWSPVFPGSPPAISVKLRSVIINLDDVTLEENTTYNIQFGNALMDYNEGNIFRNFNYTFSTGPVIDTLELSGRVVLAETGRTDSTLLVVLHNNLADSAVRTAPRYMARLDSSGNFRFRNLPAGRFNIYAIGGGSRQYMNETQTFAFADLPVLLPDAEPITLYAYQKIRQAGTGIGTASRPAATDRRIRYTTNQNGNRQELPRDLVFTFERPLRFYDSTKMALSMDSAFVPVSGFTTTLDTSRKQLTVRTSWLPDTLYHLVLQEDFAEDTLGRRLLKTDTLTFNTKALREYGKLNFRLRNISGDNPVLQFVQNDLVVFATPIRTGNFRAELFIPGDYDLRILYDRNNNGIWDPGNFFGTRIQPEIARPVGRKISVKPALENDFDISL